MSFKYFKAFVPVFFLIIGLVFFLTAEREFQRRATRDDVEFRQDLLQAGVSRSEIAALLSAHTKVEANFASYTQLSTMVALMLAMFSAIPLYVSMGSSKAAPPLR